MIGVLSLPPITDRVFIYLTLYLEPTINLKDLGSHCHLPFFSKRGQVQVFHVKMSGAVAVQTMPVLGERYN